MNQKEKQDQLKKRLRQLPGVDTVLGHPTITPLLLQYGRETVTTTVRHILAKTRTAILNEEFPDDNPTTNPLTVICREVRENLLPLGAPTLKAVINATGIILHTNLGRAPLGDAVADNVRDIIRTYSNLEYDLDTAARGKRGDHITPLLKHITHAEDALVVNNNAASLLLALNTLARNREVIISRGELIEIGGSFRIPDILAASGATMVEIGTTNKTHLYDYQNAITPNTALILKVHKSNYALQGFTHDVPTAELVKLAHSHGLPLLYDLGSGLLRKPQNRPLPEEPDVLTAIGQGVDLVAFSGDKLLGGPQAGILAGKKKWITPLSRAPMMRALRVGKITLAALAAVIRNHLLPNNQPPPPLAMLEQTPDQLRAKANELQKQINKSLNESLKNPNIHTEIRPATGQCGGGTLPTLEIQSFAVALKPPDNLPKHHHRRFAEHIFRQLHHQERPIIAILKQGQILLNPLTLPPKDFPYIAAAVAKAVKDNVENP